MNWDASRVSGDMVNCEIQCCTKNLKGGEKIKAEDIEACKERYSTFIGSLNHVYRKLGPSRGS